MPTAKKLPSGSWRCQASHNGITKSFTAYSKKEAEFLALEWQTERKEANKPENKTVRMAIDEYIAGRTNILSPTTISNYKRMADLYFQDLMDEKLQKITAADIQREINNLAESLSPKTIRNAWGLLRAACGFTFDVTMPKKRKPKYRTPDVEGIKYILRITAGTPIEVPVLLALWCGLRLSEIRGLRWDHIHPDHIYVEWAMVDVDGVPTLKKPKTMESERTVEIPTYLYNKIVSAGDHSGEYVTKLSGRAIYARFRKLTNNLCRFHDLRHANASVMMMLGIPDVYAMERGGWETESIYKKTYSQTLEEGKRNANKRIDDFFFKISHENSHENAESLLQ